MLFPYEDDNLLVTNRIDFHTKLEYTHYCPLTPREVAIINYLLRSSTYLTESPEITPVRSHLSHTLFQIVTVSHCLLLFSTVFTVCHNEISNFSAREIALQKIPCYCLNKQNSMGKVQKSDISIVNYFN